MIARDSSGRITIPLIAGAIDTLHIHIPQKMTTNSTHRNCAAKSISNSLVKPLSILIFWHNEEKNFPPTVFYRNSQLNHAWKNKGIHTERCTVALTAVASRFAEIEPVTPIFRSENIEE
jgi:hypothetical protein